MSALDPSDALIGPFRPVRPVRPAWTHALAALGLVGLTGLTACGGGGSDDPSPVPAPAPPPAPPASAPAPTPTPPAPTPPAPTPPAPTPAACGTLTALTLADLQPFEGSYAVKVYDSSSGTPAELGPATLVLSGSTLQFTPGSGLTGSAAASATVSAVCQNKDSGGANIGVVAVIDAQRHIDFFNPAFSGLYVSGAELGSSNANRYLQGRTARNTAPPPEPPQPPQPPTAGALTSYAAFQGAAPTARAVAPEGALAWLAGSYYGRSTAGACSVTIQANGSVSATMNGSTQSVRLNGDSGDTWSQLPANSMGWGVNVVEPGLGVSLIGYGPRLALVEMGGVLDKCAIAFKSDTGLSMALAGTPPLPLKSPGLQATDLPAWLIGTHNGQTTGNMLYPQTAPSACSLQVSGDGSLLVTAGGRTYSAQVSGGSSQGDRDASGTSRLSAYAALTGARDWVWSITGQSPSSSNTVQVQIELAHNGERSQVSFVSAQVTAAAGGIASQFDACYFPN